MITHRLPCNTEGQKAGSVQLFRYCKTVANVENSKWQRKLCCGQFLTQCLQGLLSLLRKFYSTKTEEAKIFLLGLNSAGKTTCLAHLSDEDVTTVIPTRGFVIKSLLHDGYRLDVWDVGGQRAIRPYWINYATSADALVYVVDAADKHRLKETGNELYQLLAEEKFRGVPLLVFANKQDLLNALPGAEILEALELNLIQDRLIHIQPCSGKFGDGLDEGMEWIIDQLKH